MSARFEIEKRKLEYKIRQKEASNLGGIASLFISALSGRSEKTDMSDAFSSNLTETLNLELKKSAEEFLEGPDQVDKLIKVATMLKGSKSSLGTVILGSILGGVLVSRFLQKSESPSASIESAMKKGESLIERVIKTAQDILAEKPKESESTSAPS